MSLERKDLRLKLSADDHAALSLLADAEDTDMADYAERVLVRVLRRRVHAAMVIAEKATRLGIVGKAFPADD
jgi:hypothetical protein